LDLRGYRDYSEFSLERTSDCNARDLHPCPPQAICKEIENMVAKTLVQALIAVVAMVVYFTPSIVADRRGRRNVLLLALMNALLGWTIVGWLSALYWALHRDSPKKVDRKAHATADAIVARALARNVPPAKAIRIMRDPY
jgi:MFS family permease